MHRIRKSKKKELIWTALLGVCLAFLFSFLLGRASVMAKETVSTAGMSRMEEKAAMDARSAAEQVQLAESSRKKVIQDSIDNSLSAIESIYRLIEASVAESVSVMESLQESVAASKASSLAEYNSIQASIEESSRQAEAYLASYKESKIVASIEASKEAVRQSSIAESLAEAARQASIAESIAEAARQASIAESRAEAARQASIAESRAEAARQASRAEASRQAAANNPPSSSGGETVFIGDSRTSGFIVYGVWPASLVFYTYSQIGSAPQLAEQAAARYPAKIIFLNGIDDIISYGNSGAIRVYEEYIARFARLSPNTRIYVGNVLPVMRKAIDRYPQLGDLNGYNALLRDMCSRHGWTYLDGSAGFSESGAFSPESDGIHFTPTWTRQWFNNLRSQAGF